MTDLHTAIEGLRDLARAEADHAEEMVKQWAVKARLEGDPAHNEQRWRADAYARREAADRLDSILASHPRGEAAYCAGCGYYPAPLNLECPQCGVKQPEHPDNMPKPDWGKPIDWEPKVATSQKQLRAERDY